MIEDFYPTRLERRMDMFPRFDPIVHGEWEHSQGPLSELELQQYREQGFLWFDGMFASDPLLGDLLADMQAIGKTQSLARSEQVVFDKDQRSLRSIFGIHELSEHFDRLTRNPRIVNMVRQLLGSDVYVHQSRINYKPGFVGNGFNWHSDFETWHAEDGMPRMRAVSVSLMLTDNNAFNGPLMLVPGSHLFHVPCVGQTPDSNWVTSLRDQQIGVPDNKALETLINRGGIRAPQGGAGSLLLFECNTLHASQRNMSPWPRANAFFVYNSVENPLGRPYAANRPRPDYLASRSYV